VEPPRHNHYRSPVQTLRRVSGRLRALWRGTDTSDPSVKTAPHLLVVDDEESICFSMKEYFSHNGFVVDTAKEIEEAELLIAKSNYRVIIQDLRMGISKDPEGLQLLRVAHERNPETLVVILTAYGSSEVEEEAKLLGADAFLRKPQPLSQVAQVIRGLLESPRRWVAPPA
jgi:two-component system response regulator PilR (NtrC family)